MVNVTNTCKTFETFVYKPIQRFIEQPRLPNISLERIPYSPTNNAVLNKNTLAEIERINGFSATMVEGSKASKKITTLSRTPKIHVEGFEFDKDFDSKSLRKLFADKYKPVRRFNEEGYPVTTVIDRTTQEPVEVYVKKIENKQTEDSKNIVYQIYRKLQNGEEELLGKRSFGFDDKNKFLTPGYMESFCKDKYEGIGTRLHQIAVEEAMSKGYNRIELLSLDQAYVFHKKSLFKVLEGLSTFEQYARELGRNNLDDMQKVLKDKGMSEKEIKALIDEEKKSLSIPYTSLNIEDVSSYKKMIMKKFEDSKMQISEKEFDACLVFDSQYGSYNKSKIEENLRRLMYQKYKKVIPLTTSIYMTLEGKNLEYWKQLVKSQPILI